jgi:predicted ArsR family transcriptional regulator
VTDRWIAVSTLADASRRALYDYVRRQDHPVAREEAAEATAMSRNLAAFHLDKLVDAGLLAARYEAPPGVKRGRGRAPKVYEPIGDGLAVTIPERRYELIAEILAGAVDTGAEPAEVAHRAGMTLGEQMRPAADIVEILAGLGFEPASSALDVRLHNCPFHALAARHTTLVCGLNHAFITGLLAGLGSGTHEARLTPTPNACCVRLHPAAHRPDDGQDTP